MISTQKQYQEAIDSIVVIMVADKNGIIKEVNQKCCAVSQYSEAELIGKSYRFICRAYDTPVFYKTIWATLSSGVPWTGHICNRAKDGSIFWVNAHIVPMMDNGELQEFLCVSTIITEQKAVEEKLLQSERATKLLIQNLSKREAEIIEQKRFTETILNNLPADIAVFNSHHKYLFVNPKGIRNEEIRKWIIGKDDYDYFRLKGKEDVYADQRRKCFNKAARGCPTEWVESYPLQDGGTKYILRKFIAYHEGGTLKYVIGYGIDITSVKMAEMMKDEYIIQLEEMAFATSHQLRHSVTNLMGIANVLDLENVEMDVVKEMMHCVKPTLKELDHFTRKLACSLHNYRTKIAEELVHVSIV